MERNYVTVTVCIVYFQAHKLEDKIHDIDLELLDVKMVSEVCKHTLIIQS